MIRTVFLFFIFVPSLLLSQNGIVRTYQATTTLDSTDIETFFLGLPGDTWFANSGQSTAAITPSNGVDLIDQLLITGHVDSLKASSAVDSLYGWVVGMDKDGYIVNDTLFYDFTNHDTTSAIQYFDASAPWNRAGVAVQGTSLVQFWIDLSGLLRNYHAFKFGIGRVGDGTSADSVLVTQNIAIGEPK